MSEEKTIMDCHQCHKQFVALLDYAVNGNHIIECPICGHEHCRSVESGKVTGERWDSRYGDDKTRAARPRRVWKADSLPARTTSAAEFIREKWFDRSL